MLAFVKGHSRLPAYQNLHSCIGRVWKNRAASTASEADYFGSPPLVTPRRVVVTGLGLVTPLGVGVAKSWKRLIAGQTGVGRLTAEHLPEVLHGQR